MNNKWFFQNSPFISQDASAGTPVTLRVDKQGFYLYWFDQNHEMDLLDIATIRDVRTGQYAKKPKVSTRISRLITYSSAECSSHILCASSARHVTRACKLTTIYFLSFV